MDDLQAFQAKSKVECLAAEQGDPFEARPDKAVPKHHQSGDLWGRSFKSLRLSLTQACNFTCAYCVAPGLTLRADKRELTTGSLISLVQAIHHVADLHKIRITGGEPLVYSGLLDILPALKELKVPQLSITTNGVLLERYSEALQVNGINQVNVSLDTLDAPVSQRLNGQNKLHQILVGLQKAKALGLKIKINTVLMRSYNWESLLPLFEYCLAQGFEQRFIELMRMGPIDSVQFQREFVGMPEILARIGECFIIKKLAIAPHATAQPYFVYGKGLQGRFGIIANQSQPFCAGCDRLRLTATGEIYGCISSTKAFQASPLLNLPESERRKAMKKLLPQALATKRADFFTGSPAFMHHLGG